MTEELILLPGDNTFIGSIDNLKKINDNVWLFINEYIDNNSTKYNWTLIDHKNNRFIDGSTTDKSGNRIISNGSAKKIEILYDRYLWIMNIENQGVGSYECKLYDLSTCKLVFHFNPSHYDFKENPCSKIYIL